MKRRLSSGDASDPDAADAPAPVASEQLRELLQSVLSRDVLSSVLSQAALSLAPKRFGNVGFGASDESNVNAFLHQKLGKENLSRRAGPRGTKLTYIESCKAIELANQAFGFNGWSCHILECKEEYRHQKNERWSIGFSSLVRIELKDGTSHEDVGFGQADGQPHLGAAIEQAKKASISDARKRALRLFGEYLGNSCYDREHIKDVHSNKPQPLPVAIPAPGGRPASSPAASASAPFVNLPPQVPAAQAIQQHQQPQQQQHQPPQHQHRPIPPAVATPSPPQTSAASVASRISALQAAEVSRLTTTVNGGVSQYNQAAANGVGTDTARSNPPMSHLNQPQASRPPAPSIAMRTTHANAPPSTTHPAGIAPQPMIPLQPRQMNQPPQPFMPRNAPPPSRMADFPVIKNEPPQARTVPSEYDMNDLSLSQFDYDPSDDGNPGATKRLRP